MLVEPRPVRVLALDPSTRVTGAVLVECCGSYKPKLLHWWAIDPSPAAADGTFEERLARIRWTREQLYTALSRCPVRPDIVAYETDTQRGHDASEALKMAAGAYLCLPHFSGLATYPITRQDACAAAGCGAIYRAPRGKTYREQSAKTARLKAAVAHWAGGEFRAALGAAWGRPEPTPEQEAVSDALAIAVAAYGHHRRKEIVQAAAMAQRPLFGKGSRGPRKSK